MLRDTSDIGMYIVGAPKCGTTSLAMYLSQHPKVHLSSPKEPHFFADDLGAKKGWRVESKPEYLECFEASGTFGDRYLDASTWYLHSPNAASNIHRASPDARVVVMMRNPIRMSFSMFEHNLRMGNESQLDIMEAMKLEKVRKLGRHVPRSAPFVHCLLYSEIGNFVPGLRRYFNVFGRDKVLVILFERFVDDPKHWTEKACEFFSIAPPPAHIQYVAHNRSTEIRNLRSLRFAKSYALVKATKKVLPKNYYSALRRLLTSRGAVMPRPTMPDSYRELMMARYEGTVSQLRELLADPIPEWEEFS